jgi:Protein of unknown function (DUF1566)
MLALTRPAGSADPGRRARSFLLGSLLMCVLLALPLTAARAMCNQDVDANGEITSTTDGLLVMRYQLGIRGPALTANVLGVGAARTDPAAIALHIATPCLQPGWVGRGTGRLNDSGIVFGGEATSGNNAGCTGVNIAQQDCSKGRDATPALNSASNGKAGFQFSKISNSGDKLPSSAVLGAGANDWACTYDHVTGLMWEVKTTSGVRNQAHTYTWYSSDPSDNGGSLGSVGTATCTGTAQCNTENYVGLVNSVVLCGRSDWRMPHKRELLSIVDYGVVTPSLDVNYFPNTPPSEFWSGSPSASGATGAWVVGFGDGSAYVGGRSFASGVRLVRAGQ